MTTRAKDIVDTLHSQLPDVFQRHRLPPTWDRDWLVAPIHAPEVFDRGEFPDSWLFGAEEAPKGGLTNTGDIPWIPELDDNPFPGSPNSAHAQGGIVPPPDALAFYLPFHYFYGQPWGIYVTIDGMRWLAEYLHGFSYGSYSLNEAMFCTRLFLYAHEAFHHAVESFATRLETTHRRPMYRAGFQQLYSTTVGTDDCDEEALANAYGWLRVATVLSKYHKWPLPKRNRLKRAFLEYFKNSPPGYRLAGRYVSQPKLDAGRFRFAEDNQRAAVAPQPQLASSIWGAFPHSFDPIANIQSRVSYIVHKHSPFKFVVEQLRIRYGRAHHA